MSTAQAAAHLCVTCGVQFAPSEQPPARCPICEDERQYVGWGGQRWTTPAEMARGGYRNELREEEPSLVSIHTTPSFGIGQRAFLVHSSRGNVLWDCISYLDDETVRAVRDLGGIQAIGISHPHFYAACVDWADTFDAQIYIHAADRQWVMRPSERYVFWEGSTVEPVPGLTLILLGGHFDGATVLHWADGAEGRGVVLSGDTIQVVKDRRFVSFMYSYPNYIPLSAGKVREIAETMGGFRYERLYGAFGGLNVLEGPAAVERSAERYIRKIVGGG